MKLLLENLPASLHDQRDTLARCLTAMDAALPIQQVILFGSHARGDARPDSDVDLCLVAEGAARQFDAARQWRTATLLSDGKVLVVGGYGGYGTYLSSAEVYNPAGSGTWSTTGSLSSARYAHPAKLLLNGRVLVAGGYNASSGYTASTQVSNPVTGIWSYNVTGSMSAGRYAPTATLLPSGVVLVAGATTAPRHPLFQRGVVLLSESRVHRQLQKPAHSHTLFCRRFPIGPPFTRSSGAEKRKGLRRNGKDSCRRKATANWPSRGLFLLYDER